MPSSATEPSSRSSPSPASSRPSSSMPSSSMSSSSSESSELSSSSDDSSLHSAPGGLLSPMASHLSIVCTTHCPPPAPPTTTRPSNTHSNGLPLPNPLSMSGSRWRRASSHRIRWITSRRPYTMPSSTCPPSPPPWLSDVSVCVMCGVTKAVWRKRRRLTEGLATLQTREMKKDSAALSRRPSGVRSEKGSGRGSTYEAI
mmetsp:Transcript_36141/g.103786  ORF Transcript_36141/g.103786 Transcript_36141/m.103786 type:complete len:200 (-) Transcript_36141:1468-2067(-)